jgi:hypothetical protein
MRHAVSRTEGLVERLYDDPPHVLVQPPVENTAQKRPHRLRRRCGRACGPIPCGNYKRKELEIPYPHVAKEVIYSVGLCRVPRVQNTEDITEDIVLAQKAESLCNPRMSRAFPRGFSRYVMKVGRPVHAQPDGEPFLFQKDRPGFVQEQSVGLDTVGNPTPGRTVSPLKENDPAKKVHPQEGRFPAVPLEVSRGAKRRGKALLDEALKHVVGHTPRPWWK